MINHFSPRTLAVGDEESHKEEGKLLLLREKGGPLFLSRPESGLHLFHA